MRSEVPGLLPLSMTTRVEYDCALAPEVYWALRDDNGYDKYVNATNVPRTSSEVISFTEDADGTVTRIAKVTALKNPIPYPVRGMLKCRDGFAFTIRETWRRDVYGAEHPCSFTTTPPVFPDRINVNGKQWVEPRGKGCRLFFEITCECTISGIGTQLANGIRDGSLTAYEQLPARALEYVTLRKASMEASEPMVRASRMTEADDTEHGEPNAEMEKARRLRARLRWRMALMGVRFTRCLELQRTDEHRLCDAKVDDLKTSDDH